MSGAWKQQQQYLFWRKYDGRFQRKSETSRQKIDCEQSLFFFRFSKGSGRARERRSCETRETRVAAREEKTTTKKITRSWKTILPGFAGGLSFFVPLPSRAVSHARGHLRVSRFARRTTEKRETARSLGKKGCTAGTMRIAATVLIFQIERIN